MKKIITGIAVLLVLLLSLGAFAFQNEPNGFRRLSFGGLIGRYTPNFGELKDYLNLSTNFCRKSIV